MPSSDEDLTYEVDKEFEHVFGEMMTKDFMELMLETYLYALHRASKKAIRNVAKRHGIKPNQLRSIYAEDDQPTQRH